MCAMRQTDKPAEHLLCKYTIEVCASKTLWVGMDGASGYENFLGVGSSGVPVCALNKLGCSRNGMSQILEP